MILEQTVSEWVGYDFAFGTQASMGNYSWSKMLAKVFKIDVTKCDHCQGDMAAVASVMERSEVVRYLTHVGIDPSPPARATPRYKEDSFDFPKYIDEPQVHFE